MRGRRTRGSTTALALAVVVATSACGGRALTLPDPDDVPLPTFAARPGDLAQSPQLAAMPARDVAGLDAEEPSASGAWLADALAAVLALPQPPTRLSRLSVYADSVHLGFPDPDVAGRTIDSFYRPGEELYVGEPRFDDSASYPIDAVDPTVPSRLVDAIERRFPLLHATSVDLDVGHSYGFGLVWYVSVSDARGTLATVYADLDGTIIAVDAW